MSILDRIRALQTASQARHRAEIEAGLVARVRAAVHDDPRAIIGVMFPATNRILTSERVFRLFADGRQTIGRLPGVPDETLAELHGDDLVSGAALGVELSTGSVYLDSTRNGTITVPAWIAWKTQEES